MLNDKPKGKDYTVVMGNFNDVVGNDKEDAYQHVIRYDLGYSND